MKTYYLFRHGETYYSKHEIPYGEHERTASILPEAKPAIENIADYLKPLSVEVAMRSEFLRCKETASIIEDRTSLLFEPNALLNEFTESEFQLFHDRMMSLVDMLQGLEATHIAICTHGAVIAALKKLMQSEAFHAHDLMYYPKTGVIVKITDRLEEIDCNN